MVKQDLVAVRVPHPVVASGARLRLHHAFCAVAPVLLACFAASPSHAQEQHKNKVLSKLSTGGPTHGEFTGTVQSLDLKGQVLNVNAARGDDIEIFPIRKNVHVSTADGKKVKLGSLTPGTTVLVNYEQKGDRRTVKQIVVLASPAEGKTKTPPPS